MANVIYSVVIGDVDGCISEVFGKLAALQSKQTFAFAIIAGNLFSDPATSSAGSNDAVARLLDGAIDIPVPTYFSLGTRGLPSAVVERLKSNDGELCSNLNYLGRRVSIKTSEGFRIVALSGRYRRGEDEPIDPFEATYTDIDAEVASKEFSEADVLVTSEWPSGIQDGSKAPFSGVSPAATQCVADLCSTLKPRYHFSASRAFLEREPFFHPGPMPRHITRFLSLAPYGNAAKEKWIYAFSLGPSAPPPQSLPPGYTASPFVATKKRKLESQEQSYNSFRYAHGNGASHHEVHNQGRKRQRNLRTPRPDECFFCLSNPACEAHMIGSIGDESYVAVAKGPLTTRSVFPGLAFPGHLLIIPLQHSPTFSAILEEEARQSTLKEMHRYRSALHDMVTTNSRADEGIAKLGAVTWEISRSGGVHLHWQFLPLAVDLITRGLVEAALKVEAENLSYPEFVSGTSEISEAEKGDYLKVMIWAEALRREMVLPLDKGFRFDLQFVRKVLAKLLALEDRMDWRACTQDQDQESADATVFKEAFKNHDFSL